MAKTKTPKYLQLRYRRWYVFLDVPKDVRHAFEGQSRVSQSLETESVTEAERRRDPIIASWKARISAAREAKKDPSKAQEILADDWRQDLANASPSERETLLQVLPEHIDGEKIKDPEARDTFDRLVRGTTLRTDKYVDQWLSTLDQLAKTKDMKRSDVLRFAERLSHTHKVSRKAIKQWVHDLQHEEGLKPATVRRILSACRGYWTYLEDRDEVSDAVAPFLNVAPPKQSRSKASREAKRRPFGPTEVVELLRMAEGEGYKQDNALAALIWFGMWTGCRIEELCSVAVSDVAEDRFLVGDAKTEAGCREVPIHPRLKERLSEWCRGSTDGYVLPVKGVNKYKKRSDAIGKRFGRLKSKAGFGPSQVFHSIRGTVATQLEQAGIPENISADILGHEKQTITYGLYSGGTAFPEKLAALEKIDYPLSGYS